jgi:hypothetical protein
MPTIVINRTSEYSNRLRNYHLFLDGKMIGTISNGQTKQFKTTPGQHTIVAKIDWCSSPEVSFTLSETDKKELTVGGFAHGTWIMSIAIGVIVLDFFLSFIFHFYYTIIFIFTVFVFIVYYVTIGRKKYLKWT